ncbi:hypothetical protein DXX98_04825 [Janibacter melonis]|nr:hypothetical protein [Janibacter melonis]
MRAVVVHDGVDLAPGATDRLLAEVERPGRRLVRVVCAPARCYVVDRELLAAALESVPTQVLAAAGEDVDALLARAIGLDPSAEVTDVDDPSTGLWRHWVDGESVGVRAAGTATPQWEAEVRRAHSTPVRARTTVRRSLGRARRAIARRRHRGGQAR